MDDVNLIDRGFGPTAGTASGDEEEDQEVERGELNLVLDQPRSGVAGRPLLPATSMQRRCDTREADHGCAPGTRHDPVDAVFPWQY